YRAAGVAAGGFPRRVARHQDHREAVRGKRADPRRAPPGPRWPSGRGGRSSSMVSLPSPFLSSFFSELEASAISCSSITPSWFASRVANRGGTGIRLPSPPGPPGPGPPGPPGPPSRRGGRSPGGGPSCALRLEAAAARASMAMRIVVFMFFVLVWIAPASTACVSRNAVEITIRAEENAVAGDGRRGVEG